jgi:hypothetical protein
MLVFWWDIVLVFGFIKLSFIQKKNKMLAIRINAVAMG